MKILIKLNPSEKNKRKQGSANCLYEYAKSLIAEHVSKTGFGFMVEV